MTQDKINVLEMTTQSVPDLLMRVKLIYLDIKILFILLVTWILGGAKNYTITRDQLITITATRNNV